MSVYVSLDLVDCLQGQKVQGECIGRTLERLLLGHAKDRPQYYFADEIVRREGREHERAVQHAEARKVTRAEKRALRRAECERLRLEAMERIGQLRKLEL